MMRIKKHISGVKDFSGYYEINKNDRFIGFVKYLEDRYSVIKGVRVKSKEYII